MLRFMHSFKRAIAIALIGFLSVAAPLPAYAWTVEPFSVEAAVHWILTEIIQKLFEQAIMIPFQSIVGDFINGGSNSIGSAINKEIAANSQLVQADLNYRALLQANERAAKAFFHFASEGSYAYGTCETAGTAQGLGDASTATRLAIKADVGAGTAYDLYQVNASQTAAQVAKQHATEYCSDLDAQLGRGCTPVAKEKQNADLSAGTLIPNGGGVYSDDELAAANAYVTMVTSPVPQEMLPLAMEQTPTGKQFVTAQRAAAARMSVPRLALNQIKGMYTKANALASTVVGPAGDLSVAALMNKIVTERFGSQAYATSLMNMQETGLLKEAVVMVTSANWMAYQTYLQQEPAELVAATHAALVARQDAEQRLSALRTQVSAINRN